LGPQEKKSDCQRVSIRGPQRRRVIVSVFFVGAPREEKEREWCCHGLFFWGPKRRKRERMVLSRGILSGAPRKEESVCVVIQPSAFFMVYAMCVPAIAAAVCGSFEGCGVDGFEPERQAGAWVGGGGILRSRESSQSDSWNPPAPWRGAGAKYPGTSRRGALRS
jgi:hypothetical protein